MTTMNADNNTDWMDPHSIRGNDASSAALGKDLTVAQSLTLLGLPITGITIGDVMTWDGSTWVSDAPSSSGLTQAQVLARVSMGV